MMHSRLPRQFKGKRQRGVRTELRASPTEFVPRQTKEMEVLSRPVAQLVERWTPGSESPGSRRSGARYMKLLTGMARLVGAAAAS